MGVTSLTACMMATASEELQKGIDWGQGGSWSTCTNGCHLDPPQDVAHVQFQSRIAFKLVWAPPHFRSFVLVDDDGNLLNHGTPTGALPDPRYRQSNYRLTVGGKYSTEAESFGKASSQEPMMGA